MICHIKKMNREIPNNLEGTKIIYDVVIVGAGVAGSALAHALGKDGHEVHVIERNLNEPNRIVGELLQPSGYLKLLELGLADCVKDIDAQHVQGYAVHNNGKSITLPFPLENYDDSNVAGRTFHNGRFVQKMREKAASLPNVKMEQGTVTSLIEENETIKGVCYKTTNGHELISYASLTIVCDGCFSSLRKFLANPKIDTLSYGAGFILENCQIPHPDYAHIIFGDPVSSLFYPISSTEVRFFANITGQKIPSISNGDMARFLKKVVAPQVPDEMSSAFISAVDGKGGIRIMPVRSMAAAPRLIPGAILLGDALNMRHVITGGGMSVALHDVSILSNLLRHLNLDDTSSVTKITESFYKYRKPMAFTMNLMADTLHMVLCESHEETRKEIHQACFDFLSLGHGFSTGLVGLISGLNPQPRKAILYLFSIAFYMVGAILFPFPSSKRAFAASRLVSGAAAIAVPFMVKDVRKQVSLLQKLIYCKRTQNLD